MYILTFGLTVLVCAFPVIFTHFISAEPSVEDSSVKVELVISGLSSPTGMAFVDPRNLLVLEKNSGEVRLVSNGELKEDPILKLEIDSTTSTCCRGLLGIAVDNKNATNTKDVFLYFTAVGKDNTPVVNKVVKYKWNGRNLINSQIMLELPATPGPNHPGGKLVIDTKGNIYTVIGRSQ